MTTETSAVQMPKGKLRQWIVNHDDKWMFIIPYISLAVILSIVLSLFWLVVVVAVHFVLEIFRQRYLADLRGENANFFTLLLRTLWETKLDIG